MGSRIRFKPTPSKSAEREDLGSFFVSQRSGTRDKPFIMTQGGAYITEVSEHSEGHQQIHFKVAVPENCVRMDLVFGEHILRSWRPASILKLAGETRRVFVWGFRQPSTEFLGNLPGF